MQMTVEEIVRSYKSAADPKKQIGILAELNATDRGTIRAILIDAGLMKSDGAAPKKALRTQAARESAVEAMLKGGSSMREVAAEVGMDEKAVRQRRDELIAAGEMPPTKNGKELKAVKPKAKKEPEQKAEKPKTGAKPQTVEELDAVIARGVQEGLSVREIAAKANCAENTVYSRKRKMERSEGWEAPKTEEEKEERITEGIRRGLSVREIAEHAGCAENTVRRRLERPEAPEKPKKPVHGSIPVSARVAAVIHAVPENATAEEKVIAFDLCREMMKRESL